MSKVAPIGVFPRKYFNRSNFGIPKVARNEDVFEGFGLKIVSGSLNFAQNEDVFKGFGVFGATLGFPGLQIADAHYAEHI